MVRPHNAKIWKNVFKGKRDYVSSNFITDLKFLPAEYGQYKKFNIMNV